MKPGTMLKDIARSLVRKPVTERYPFERRPAPDRLRGQLIWNPDACTGCGLCALDCPADAIEVLVIDKKAKIFEITYHLDRCTFCGQCVESCRQGCLEMQDDQWELAALDRGGFTILRRKDGATPAKQDSPPANGDEPAA